MPKTKLITGYLATAVGSANFFTIFRDGDTFTLEGLPGNPTGCSSICRLELYDKSETLLAVLACSPCLAGADPSKCNTLSISGKQRILNVAVNLTSLLSASEDAVQLVMRLAIEPDSQSSGIKAKIFSIGDYSFVNTGPLDTLHYSVLQRLVDPKGLENYQITLTATAGDTAFSTATGATKFGAGSKHVTFLVRKVLTPDGKSHLPVLVLRRGFTEPDPGIVDPRFQIKIELNGDDSFIHAAQFPSPDWLATQPTGYAAEWNVEISGFTQRVIHDFWENQVRAVYLRSLRTINEPLQLSLLPTVPTDDETPERDFLWRLTYTLSVGIKTTMASSLLQPGSFLENEDTTPITDTKFSCDLTGLADYHGQRITFANAVLKAGIPAWNISTKNSREVHKMVFEVDGLTNAQGFRLGSLELDLSANEISDNTDGTDNVSRLRVTAIFDGTTSPDFDGTSEPERYSTPRIRLNGLLPVAAYGPGGQDFAPVGSNFVLSADDSDTGSQNFVRKSPIVIDATPVHKAAVPRANYLLQVGEWTQGASGLQAQQIVLQLFRAKDVQNSGLHVLVLDREPFLVAKVLLESEDKNDDTTEVGTWCNVFPEGPGWRLRDGAKGFQLLLPPQAIGEAMVKGAGYSGHQPTDGETIDFRFSPLLSASLSASYNAQNAVEPGWNTRRVFGFAGQRAPGAAVNEKTGGVNFELLYGLSASVTQPNLRMAEIFARLGNMLGPLPDLSDRIGYTKDQQSQYALASSTWGALYKQTYSRPGVLELWDDHQGAELLLDEGVQYKLRDTADVQYPDGTSKLPGGKNGKLAGGIGWALDSANVADELLTNPVSVQGLLSKPMFTSLGGFGTQRAVFANGKVIIDSRTSLGRLESLTVTLVGRVGVLWNHALHVTVYERSVLPSQQFQDEQEPLQGRPLLRKTSEYVELLQQVRSYPENGGGAVTRAFVVGSSFKTKRIPVDSRWGGDVGKIGWQVPLWQSWEDQDVYPRPHIALSVAVDPDLGLDSLASEILDPDKLCFYTDTQTNTTADTELWVAVSDIDFADQPDTADPSVEGQPFSIVPGFGRFTYHLADLPIKTNLVAARVAPSASAASSNPVGSDLANATMMRSKAGIASQTATGGVTPPKPGPQQAAQQQVRRLKDWWSVTQDRLKQPFPQGKLPDLPAVQKAVTDRFDALEATYTANLKSDLALPTGTNVVSACDSVAQRLDSAIDRTKDSLDGIARHILLDLPDHVKAELTASFTAGDQQLGRKLSDAVADSFALISKGLAPFTGGFTDAVDLLQRYDKDLNALDLSGLKGVLKAGVKSVDDAHTLQTALLNFQSTVQRDRLAVDRATRLVIGDSGSSLTSGFAALPDAILTQVNNALTRVISEEQAVTSIAQSLLSQIAQGLDDVTAKIQDMRKAIANAITALTAARSDLEVAFDSLEATLQAEVSTIAAATLEEFKTKLDQAFTNAGLDGKWNKTVQDWLTAHETWIPKAGNLCKALQQDLDKLENEVLDAIETKLKQGALDAAAEAFAAGKDIEAAIADAVDAAGQRIGRQLDQVTHQLTQSLGGLAQRAGDLGASAYNVAGSALRVLRAFGDAPQVPNLSFALPRLAYLFDDTKLPVGITNTFAELQQAANGLAAAGNALSQMNVHLPTASILDRLIPNNIGNFNLNDILPSFAGLNLEQLFAGVRMPALGSDGVRITHKIDPQSRRASLDADVKIPLTGSSSLFDIGPVTLALIEGQFNAHVHLEAGSGQQLQRTSDGSIFGDWQLRIGGMVLLSFVRTTLQFDTSGKLHFSISPTNVRLHAALQFLADLLNKLNLGGGVVIHATAQPVRVECSLDLPLPDIAGGAFAIRNLRLGAAFSIGLEAASGDFYMEVAANLARETAPFTLTIFILGGTGWFEVSLIYIRGKLTGLVTLGIGASASLAIALGPINGSVSITFALFAQLRIGNGGLSLGIMILVAGHVSVLGIVEADLILLLEAQYTSGGGLVGRGMVSLKIKICWCFTLEVSKSVEYRFGSSGGSGSGRGQEQREAMVAGSSNNTRLTSPPNPPPALTFKDHRKAAVAYINMLA